jgi:ankyrin repeat protein
VKILFNCTTDNCTTDDQYRYTPLIYASIFGHVEVVRVLLEGGVNVEKANANQWTALHSAACYGYLEVCRLLLDWGAKVDPVNRWKDTPLHCAARFGHLSGVKLLVERGADVRLKNISGQTATDAARSKGKTYVAEWLDLLSLGKVL